MIEQAEDRLAARIPQLARLGVVYADELRIKIVTEAHVRPISPTGFHAEFGGGSVPRVAQHFERLAEADWLVLDRTETGGARRGAVEHFWRAPELVVFEEEDWAALPLSIRVGFGWITFEQLTERVGAAMLEGTFDARPERHLSWSPLALDEQGWRRLLERADTICRSLMEEQRQAGLRISESGEEPISAIVAIAVFESPPEGAVGDPAGAPPPPRAREDGATTPFNGATFLPMLSKVFGNAVDLRIIELLNRQAMSAKLLHEAIPEVTLAGHDRRLKKLLGQGWAAEVGRKTGGARRSATERFYAAARPTLIDNPDWGELPERVRATISAGIFGELSDRVRQALETGTLVARPESHLTWQLLRFDRRGWSSAVALLDGFLEQLLEERRAAGERLERSGGEPILTTVGLAAFEAARNLAKAP